MGDDESGRDDVDARRRILAVVQRHPGLHLREIQRKTGTSARLAEYHLNQLEEMALVTSAEEEGYRRFFPREHEERPLDRREKRWLGLLRQEVPLGVALYLLDHGTARHADLADVVPVGKSTLSHHIGKMEDAGMLERHPPQGPALRLADPDIVRKLLQTHEPLRDLISSYGDMWDAIFGAFREGDDGSP